MLPQYLPHLSTPWHFHRTKKPEVFHEWLDQWIWPNPQVSEEILNGKLIFWAVFVRSILYLSWLNCEKIKMGVFLETYMHFLEQLWSSLYLTGGCLFKLEVVIVLFDFFRSFSIQKGYSLAVLLERWPISTLL